MIRKTVQESLYSSYEEWKSGLQVGITEAGEFSAPLLLSVTDDYCQAEKRIIVFGQETYGWLWDSTLTERYPDYPVNWPYRKISSLADFMQDPDGVKNLCWGYHAFDFAHYQPQSYKTLFWQAFREVKAWPNAGVMWSNVSRCDYSAGKNGNSIFQAPEDVREEIVTSQKTLIRKEIEILKPHACVFFSGPYYDPLLTASFPDCKFLPCSPQTVRQVAQLDDASLPSASFRTYHPNFLNRAGKWDFIDLIKSRVCS